MVTNVEAALFAASCSGHIRPALVVHGNRYGIGNGGISRPFRDNKLRFCVGILTGGWSSGDPGNMDCMNVGPVIFIAAKNREPKETRFPGINLIGNDATAGLALKSPC